MRKFLISAVGLTTLTAALLVFPTELTAGDRSNGARDRASNARDGASAARDAARDRASASRDVASAARDAARDRASASRDVASAARDAAHDRADAARDVASATRDQARGSVGADGDDAVVEVEDRDVVVSANGDRSYSSVEAWVDDLKGWWSDPEPQRSGDEASAHTSVAVGNAVSKQTATTSGGDASISLSTKVSSTDGGRTVSQVQRATID